MILYKRDYLIFGFVVIMLVLYGVRIKLNNDLSTLGIKVQKIQDKTKLVRFENDRIRTKILEAESFTAIASRAADMGFTQTKNDQYIYLK